MRRGSDKFQVLSALSIHSDSFHRIRQFDDMQTLSGLLTVYFVTLLILNTDLSVPPFLPLFPPFFTNLMYTSE